MYVEAYFDANTERNAAEALDVGLCSAYGIGTQQDWDKCLEWIKKAAALGNPVALIFAKRLLLEGEDSDNIVVLAVESALTEKIDQ